MSIPCKFERSILTHSEENEIVLRSHHPWIYDVELGELNELRRRLRAMRDKERTLARASAGRRAAKERREGGAFRDRRAFLATQTGVRSRVEAREQRGRSHAEAGHGAHIEAARRALAMRRAAQFPRVLRPVTRRARASLRCRADGDVHAFLPRRSGVCPGNKKSASYSRRPHYVRPVRVDPCGVGTERVGAPASGC